MEEDDRDFECGRIGIGCYILRNIWLRRNIFIFEDLFTSLATIFKQAMMTIAEFKEVNCIGRSEDNFVKRELVRRKMPREGVTKVN